MTKYIICCDPVGYIYFKEYLSCITKKYNASILIIEKDYGQYKYECDNIYIFCQHIPNNILLNQNIKKIMINTEQLTIQKWYDKCKTILDSNVKVIDYGLENIQIMNNPNNMIYLPYQYDILEIDKLKNFLDTPKLYDVAFCGDLSDRRRRILNKLQDNKIKVLNIVGWDDIRDQQFAQCKLLLNIHFSDEYNVYESLRCDRWLFAGLPIVSEISINNVSLDVNELVIFKEYDELINAVIEIINNYNNFKANYDTKYNKKIIHIITMREKFMLE